MFYTTPVHAMASVFSLPFTEALPLCAAHKKGLYTTDQVINLISSKKNYILDKTETGKSIAIKPSAGVTECFFESELGDIVQHRYVVDDMSELSGNKLTFKLLEEKAELIFAAVISTSDYEIVEHKATTSEYKRRIENDGKRSVVYIEEDIVERNGKKFLHETTTTLMTPYGKSTNPEDENYWVNVIRVHPGYTKTMTLIKNEEGFIELKDDGAKFLLRSDFLPIMSNENQYTAVITYQDDLPVEIVNYCNRTARKTIFEYSLHEKGFTVRGKTTPPSNLGEGATETVWTDVLHLQ